MAATAVVLITVWPAPAPRSVTPDLTPNVIGPTSYTPAERQTTWPGGQAAMAALISSRVLDGVRVLEMVDLSGIPPGTPAEVQSYSLSAVPDAVDPISAGPTAS